MGEWAQNAYYDGGGNYQRVVLTGSLDVIMNKIVKGEFGNQLNGIENYIHGTLYFPFRSSIVDMQMASGLSTSTVLTISDGLFSATIVTKKFNDISASTISRGNVILNGYYMGKYDFKNIIEDSFEYYEPYAHLLVYLPFYGYAELSVKDVVNKIVYFRLTVDFRTGQGTYYLYAHEDDIDVEINPGSFFDCEALNELYNVSLIGKYDCQVGIEIPLNSTGSANKTRNAIISASEAAITTGIAMATSNIPVAYSASRKIISEQNSKLYSRNPKTNRVSLSEDIKVGGYSVNTEHISYDNKEVKIINEMANLANNVIANFSSQPSMSRGGSPINSLYSSPDIHIVYKKSKLVQIDEDYDHIFGKPLGVIYHCNLISGFTKFSNFHLEAPRVKIQENPTSNLGLINSEELAMINDIMTTGVYL